MLVIKTKRQIVVFACAITIFTLFSAEFLNILLFPEAILHLTMRGTLIIVGVITVPTAVWIGSKMRENTLLALELRRLVDRDRLTDVATRDFFFAQMDRQPDVYGVSLMVDIDRFKAVNDQYGHMAGDAVIQKVAMVLRKHLRPQDIVCRFGGEEFVIFLHQKSTQDGFLAAERLRESIADIQIPYDGDMLTVTVSIGGSVKDKIDDVNRAIKEADAALYQAKRSGRNRTVFAGDWVDTVHASA